MPLYLKLLHAAFATELSSVTPVIFVLLSVGLATAIFQSALQIEEATFSLLPKTIAMIALGLLGGLGALHNFESFARLLITHAPAFAHQAWY